MADNGIVFAGQKHSIGRAQTQVFGITDKRDFSIRRAQTMGSNPSNNSNPIISTFTNPMRDSRDIELQVKQQNSNIKVHMPVSQRAIPLQDGTIANNEKLFKELKGIYRIICFGLSVIIILLFAYIAFMVSNNILALCKNKKQNNVHNYYNSIIYNIGIFII